MEFLVKLFIMVVVGFGLLGGLAVGLKKYFDSGYEKALGIALPVAMIVMSLLGSYLGYYD